MRTYNLPFGKLIVFDYDAFCKLKVKDLRKNHYRKVRRCSFRTRKSYQFWRQPSGKELQFLGYKTKKPKHILPKRIGWRPYCKYDGKFTEVDHYRHINGVMLLKYDPFVDYYSIRRVYDLTGDELLVDFVEELII